MDTSRFSTISFPSLGLEINPPRGFELFGFSIRIYGIIIAVGLLLAVLYGLKRSKKFGLKEDDILDGVLGIVPFAIICARLYYCLFSWDTFKDNPISILYIWEGGLAIYGGVLGAALGVMVFCLIKKIKLGAVLDIVALGFLIGQSIGRWGNFFNREAFGAETESFLRMGLFNTYSQSFQYFHPTFLYESLWNLAGFVILHFLSKKRRYDGQIALGYVVWYGLGRTFIEGLRMDSLMLGNFRVSQLLAAVSCFAAATALVLLAFKKHDPAKLFVNVMAAKEAEAEAAAAAEAAEEETAEEASEEETAEETEAPAEENTEETEAFAEDPAEETEETEENKDE
jgi:phosphatidylglycerol:prolipoprotein diacylglycerol transferase